MEFSRPEYWSGWLFPSPGDLPNPGIEPGSLTLQADFLPAELPEKPKNTGVHSLSLLQWIFPTQESNWGLLHCRQILYQLQLYLSKIGRKNGHNNNSYSIGSLKESDRIIQRILHSGQPKNKCSTKVIVFTITIRTLESEIKMVIESYKEYSTWRSHWGNVKL